jgi:hypothetical protein
VKLIDVKTTFKNQNGIRDAGCAKLNRFSAKRYRKAVSNIRERLRANDRPMPIRIRFDDSEGSALLL